MCSTIARLALAVLLMLLLGVPALADAGKGKKKAPKYSASLSVTGHMGAAVDCEAWTSNWTYGADYKPTRLESLVSLDAKSRTGGGLVDWTRDTCPPLTPTSGNCPIVVESPADGEHAGDEDGFLQKADGGLRVAIEFVQFMTQVGTAETCRGGIYAGGGEGTQEERTQGFIPSGSIGKKVISVPIAGSITWSDVSEFTEAQINGTLTLTRIGKKPGK